MAKWVPSRSVPMVAWRAPNPWRTSPLTFSLLVTGLSIFGFGEGLLVQSRLGATPWTVLAQGISHQLGIAIGATTFLLSAVVLLGWIPLRQRIGIGTIANAIVIAVVLEYTTKWLYIPHGFVLRFGYSVGGVLAIGFGGALYLTCGLGPGPRDGLMTGLQQRLNSTVARVRFCLEVSVLVIGWLLGGVVGIGTAMFAFGVGYALALFLSFFRMISHRVEA